MLVISRQLRQKTFITVPPSSIKRTIEVTVERIDGAKVRLGFDAGKDIKIDRAEVLDAAGLTPAPIRKD